MKITVKKIMAATLVSCALSGCAAPLIVAAGASGVTMAAKDKGVSGTINDTSINTGIASRLYEKSAKGFTQVDTDVQMGEVLLTGSVDDPAFVKYAEEQAWKVGGVIAVYNHIQTEKDASLLDYTKDSWITTKVKSKFLAEKSVHSLNYFVKTVGGTVYLMGIADTEKEFNIVHKVTKETDGVKKVISYVKKKGIDE